MRNNGEETIYRDRNMVASFQMNYPGIVRYAMESRELGAALEELARDTVVVARTISPTGGSAKDNSYRDSWSHQPYTERNTGDPPFPRQAQLVMNDAPHALDVEFGTGRGDTYESFYGYRIFPQLLDYLDGRT